MAFKVKTVWAFICYVAALVAFAEWSNHRSRSREISASVVPAQLPITALPLAEPRDIAVAIHVPDRFGAKNLAVVAVVIPSRVRDVLELTLPTGWRELATLPAITPGAPARPVPSGYTYWAGRLLLEDGSKAVLRLPAGQPARGRGEIQLRYLGQGEMCPVAGTLRVTVGGGPPVPFEELPFPDDPIARLAQLC